MLLYDRHACGLIAENGGHANEARAFFGRRVTIVTLHRRHAALKART
jgi:hypothetical protein